ncbi:MAG: YfcE family phosphodiesterase [Actinomycetota bacterium]
MEAVRAADLVVHAGDLTSAAFLDELRSYGPPVHVVGGNADEPALRAVLPEQLVLEVDDARIGVVHVPGPAAGREGRLVRRFPGCDAVVFGHTHLPVVERVDGVWLLNPGSPTERRRGPFRSFLLLRVSGRTIEPELVEIRT